MKSYYQILQIDKEASLTVIKVAYKALSQKYHPDKNSGVDTTQIFQEIQEAYDVLSDVKKKEIYDLNYLQSDEVEILQQQLRVAQKEIIQLKSELDFYRSERYKYDFNQSYGFKNIYLLFAFPFIVFLCIAIINFFFNIS